MTCEGPGARRGERGAGERPGRTRSRGGGYGLTGGGPEGANVARGVPAGAEPSEPGRLLKALQPPTRCAFGESIKVCGEVGAWRRRGPRRLVTAEGSEGVGSGSGSAAEPHGLCVCAGLCTEIIADISELKTPRRLFFSQPCPFLQLRGRVRTALCCGIDG